MAVLLAVPRTSILCCWRTKHLVSSRVCAASSKLNFGANMNMNWTLIRFSHRFKEDRKEFEAHQYTHQMVNRFRKLPTIIRQSSASRLSSDNHQCRGVRYPLAQTILIQTTLATNQSIDTKRNTCNPPPSDSQPHPMCRVAAPTAGSGASPAER